MELVGARLRQSMLRVEIGICFRGGLVLRLVVVMQKLVDLFHRCSWSSMHPDLVGEKGD